MGDLLNSRKPAGRVGNMALGAIIRKDFSQLVFVFLSFALMVLVSYLLVSRIVEREIYSNI